MSPQDFFEGIAHLISMKIEEALGGEAGGGEEPAPEAQQYEAEEPIEAESNAVEGMTGKRINYDGAGMSQAGGADTFIPGSACNKGKRTMYERGNGTAANGAANGTATLPAQRPAAVVTRQQYDADLTARATKEAEDDEIMAYLYTKVQDMEVRERRLLYQRDVPRPDPHHRGL